MKSRWLCPRPECGSDKVQISLPAWYTESIHYELEFVQTDTDADVMYWYCEECNEGGAGTPNESPEVDK